jgi:alpha-beta hydrolase superfamily lysophospholipase
MLRVLACAAAVLAAAVANIAPADPASRWDGCTPKAGDVRFTAADGTKLVGHRFGSGRTAVVLVHQMRGSICQWASYAKRLAGLGYTAFALDLRGYGDSQRRAYPANQRYGGDVAAAVKVVRRLGARKVFLVGASLGGSAAVSAAANTRPSVNGVVSVSGAADLAGAIGAVPHVQVPSLFIAGADDTDFAKDARRLYAASAAKDKTLEVLPGAYEHGTRLVAARSSVRSLIENFLRAH